MDTAEIISAAHQIFLDRLDQVQLDDLELATPCERWSVGDLLRHVTGGNRMAVALLEGADASSIGPLFSGASELDGAELVAAASESTIAASAALAGVKDPSRIVHFPIGDVTAGRLQGFRTIDLALHAWDLARGIDVDDRLPEPVVDFCLAGLEAMAESVPAGMFGAGPSGELPAGADAQARLLDLSGRRT